MILHKLWLRLIHLQPLAFVLSSARYLKINWHNTIIDTIPDYSAHNGSVDYKIYTCESYSSQKVTHATNKVNAPLIKHHRIIKKCIDMFKATSYHFVMSTWRIDYVDIMNSLCQHNRITEKSSHQILPNTNCECMTSSKGNQTRHAHHFIMMMEVLIIAWITM